MNRLTDKTLGNAVRAVHALTTFLNPLSVLPPQRPTTYALLSLVTACIALAFRCRRAARFTPRHN